METNLELEWIKIKMQMMYGKKFAPKVRESDNWYMWKAIITSTTCQFCYEKSGTVFNEKYKIDVFPPVHEKCRCFIMRANAILAGTATVDGLKGADYSMKHNRRLPLNYITKKEAKQKGWKASQGNLSKVLSESVIGGNVYQNKEGKLPKEMGRIWYEADINYMGGRRNSHRLMYSNDGLIFVTYDHYLTFYEII